MYVTLLGDISGAGIPYPSRVPDFTTFSSGINVAQSLIFCVVFRILMFVLFILDIVLAVLLPFTATNYQFVIVNHFFLSFFHLLCLQRICIYKVNDKNLCF